MTDISHIKDESDYKYYLFINLSSIVALIIFC